MTPLLLKSLFPAKKNVFSANSGTFHTDMTHMTYLTYLTTFDLYDPSAFADLSTVDLTEEEASVDKFDPFD